MNSRKKVSCKRSEKLLLGVFVLLAATLLIGLSGSEESVFSALSLDSLSFDNGITGAAIGLQSEIEESVGPEPTIVASESPSIGTQESFVIGTLGSGLGEGEAPILNSSSLGNQTDENLTVYYYEGVGNKTIIDWKINGGSIAVLNMPFENNTADTSATTKDYSPYSNNGTVTGATWSSTGGYDGKGVYEFDGSDRVDLGDNTAMEFVSSGEFTISAWVNNTDGANAIYCDSWIAAGTNNGFLFYLSSGNPKAYFSTYQTGSKFDAITSSDSVNNGEYHHLVLTYNNKNASIYVDGQISNSTLLDLNDGSLHRVSYDKLIGSSFDVNAATYTSEFNGNIDEVMVFSKSLSAEQILALYNNRTDLIVSQETSLGDNWSVCVTPNDGTEDGVEQCTGNLTVLADINNIPMVSNLILNSTLGTNYSSENITASWSVTDGDLDAIKNITNWKLNGESITILNVPFETDGLSNITNYASDAIGTVQGGTYNSTGGYDGKGAFEFDGGTVEADQINFSNINLNHVNYAIEVWAKFNDNTGQQPILSLNTPFTNDDLILGIDNSDFNTGNITFAVYYSSQWREVSSTTLPVVGQWYHIVAVQNATNQSIYINGQEEGVSGNNATPTKDTLSIGTRKYNNINFDGTVDEFKIYNHSLSAEQISALYNNRTDLIVSQETSLGENWSTCVTPNDGTEDGLEVCSGNLTVLAEAAVESTTIANSTSCGLVNGNITLITNVTSTGTCFNINSSNVIIDCNGYFVYSGLDAGDNLSYVISAENINSLNISNCILIQGENASEYVGNGISFTNVSGLTFTNNQVYNNLSFYSPSVYCDNCSHSIIQNNIIYGNIKSYSQESPALEIESSQNVSLINNTLFSESNNGEALNLNDVNNFYLINNTISGNGTSTSPGIEFTDSNDISLDGNFIYSQNAHGVYIEDGINYTFYNNSINSTEDFSLYIEGTLIEHFNHTIGIDNTVDGLSLLYNFSASNEIVLSNVNASTTYGQIICAWCDNVTYSNITVASDGIDFFRVNNSYILNSSFYNPKADSIYSSYSSNNTYNGNLLSSIILAYSNEENVYSNNVRYYLGDTPGIGIITSTGTNISNNVVNASCGVIPFYACGDPSPISISYSNNLFIKNNSLYAGIYGMEIGSGSYCIIEDNYIQNSIHMGNSESHHNNFTSNQIDGPISCTGDMRFIDNTINISSNDVAVSLDGGDNVLINNTIISPLNYEITSSSDYNNSLTYENIYGMINWTTDNITTTIPLILGQTIFLENNTIGLIDNSSALSLNGSAQITFYSLNYSIQPYLLKNEVRCDDNSALCNITSYDNTTGTLIAQVSSFSNYSTQDSMVDNSPSTSLISPAVNYINDSAATTSINFSCNATDDYQLVNISLYLTNSTNQSFVLNQTTSITGISNSTSWSLNLTTGNYTWNCLAYDNSSQTDWAENRTITLNYTSDNYPYWSINTTSIVATYSSSTESYFNVTWQDDNSVSTVYLESNYSGIATNYSMNSLTSTIYNYSTILSAGTHYWKSYANDSTNQWNVTDQWNFTIAQNIENCDVGFNETSPLTYPAAFQAYTNCTSAFILYRNGTSTTNNSVQSLAVGSYNFTVVRTDQSNYSSYYDEEIFTVAQTSSEVNTTINNSESNISLAAGSTIDLNCTLITGESDVYLYNNGTLINSGTSPLGNSTTFSSEGLYNITCLYQSTQNYSASSETYWVNVTQYPIVELVSPAASYTNSSAAVINITFECNATDLTNLQNISLYLTDTSNSNFALNQTTNITGTSNSSNWTLELGVGTYTWNCLSYDNLSESNWADVNRTITQNYAVAVATPAGGSSGGGGGGSSVVCGDTVCAGEETCDGCPGDCGVCPTEEVPEEVKEAPKETGGTSEEVTEESVLSGEKAINDDLPLFGSAIALMPEFDTYLTYGGSIVLLILLILTIIKIISLISKRRRIKHEIIPSKLSAGEQIIKTKDRPIVIQKAKHKKVKVNQPSLKEEYDYVNQELLQLEEERNIPIIKKEVKKKLKAGRYGIKELVLQRGLRKVDARLHGYPTRKPIVIKASKENIHLNNELNFVDKELTRVDKRIPKNIKVITRIPDRKKTYGNKSLDRELNRVTSTLANSIRNPGLLLRNIFPKKKVKSVEKLAAERKAQEEVIRISRKTEGKNPLPKNELQDVEEKLAKLRKRLEE
jgi:hypothetical protein